MTFHFHLTISNQLQVHGTANDLLEESKNKQRNSCEAETKDQNRRKATPTQVRQVSWVQVSFQVSAAVSCCSSSCCRCCRRCCCQSVRAGWRWRDEDEDAVAVSASRLDWFSFWLGKTTHWHCPVAIFSGKNWLHHNESEMHCADGDGDGDVSYQMQHRQAVQVSQVQQCSSANCRCCNMKCQLTNAQRIRFVWIGSYRYELECARVTDISISICIANWIRHHSVNWLNAKSARQSTHFACTARNS